MVLCKMLEKLLENHKDDDDDDNEDSVFPESAPEEDFQLSTTCRLAAAQVSHHKHDTCQDLPEFNLAKSEDVLQSSQIPPRLQEHEFAEMESQATGRQRTSTIETSSVSVGPPEEGTHSNTQALNCLNFTWVFLWLRQQVLSSLLGREHPEMATEIPSSWHKGKDALTEERESNLKTPF
ncbi:hypothetical protein MC885_021870, partial [Smutsia gigantea]